MRRANWMRLDPSERRCRCCGAPRRCTAPETSAAVRAIIDAVRAGGDAALRE